MVALLNNIASIIMGQSPKSSFYNEGGKGLPFYQGKAEFGENYPTPVKWCSKPGKVAEKGDVLISVRAPVGPTNICQEKSCIGRGLAAVRPLGGMPTQYLRYWLSTRQRELEAKSTGTTFKAISGDTLRNLEINLPPLPEQKRIVAKIESLFSRLDSAKDSLERVRAEIKRYRQAVLKWAFDGKLTHAGDISEVVELRDIILESRIGLVRSNSQQNNQNIGIPYIKMNNIDMDGNLDLRKLVFVKVDRSEITKYSLRQGDLLVNTRNSFELVGKSAVVKNDSVERVYNNNIVRLRLKEDYNPYFIGLQMVAPRVQKEMRLGKKATTNICALYQKDLFPLKFRVCNYKQQSQIVQAIESCFDRVRVLEDAVEQGLEKIDRLKQSILKKAFEGKLVEPEPAGEPVEVLLERIKKEQAKLK